MRRALGRQDESRKLTPLMTDVSFHFNVPDDVLYACRLLRKAVRKGARVAVVAPPPTLSALDRALWTFDPTDFVAHVRLAPGSAAAPRLSPTPVWLVENTADAPEREVLVNLGDNVAPGFESFGRVIEIVGADETGRQAGRERWKHYTSRGYTITRHDVADER